MRRKRIQVAKEENQGSKKKVASSDEKIKLPGYPAYPASEDIYSNDKEETDLDPEDISKVKEPNENPDAAIEEALKGDLMGSALDVPGSELDDQQESIGNEDEENNYYSVGGDNHIDLEESKGS